MRHQNWISIVACSVAVTVGAMNLFADDKKPAAAAGAPDMAAMMEAWQKHATPGKEHADLAKDVGEWTTLMEDFSSGTAEKSNGTSKCTMVMGGRYLMEEVKGTSMGMPFEGLMLLGYDNTLKRYDSTWIDSMGTSISSSHGTMKDGKLELSGDMTCPIAPNNTMPVRSVTNFDGDDKRVMEMYMPGPDGKEMLAFRLTYTRKK